MSVDDNTVAWLQLALCLAGAALLAWGQVLARLGRADAMRRLRDGLLAVLGVLGAAAYFNFGDLHHPRFIHNWDTFHYYMGSKYFPELGYERLYLCTIVVEAERGFTSTRTIRDLRNNEQVRTYSVRNDPEACKAHFTPERWTSFRRDMAFFHGRESERRWSRILNDHGYNATPVWNALGQTLANTGPATAQQVTALNLLDPVFLLAMVVMIAWAFGWRVAAVAALFFGTDIAGRYLWTGGSFLRHDWLFWLVGSICLLKKDRPFLAGGFIAYATLLRLFPGLAILGPMLALIAIYRRDRRLDRGLLRYFAGGIAATVVLVGASVAVSGPESWRDFARNTEKHLGTALTNNMGLPALLAYRPDTTVAQLTETSRLDPIKAWRAAHAEGLREARPVFIALCIAFAVLLYLAVVKAGAEPWIAASLGIGMLAVGVELTCYYYCFFVGLVLAMYQRPGVGILILLMNAGWLLMERYSHWGDEKFVAMSALAVAVYALILLRFAWPIGFRKAATTSPSPASPVPDSTR
ncbi:hypothetical protein BWI17_17315 [Betaproteobacteria bacterium GR16-43]|nr:hypothetical protein BWI17_17315 [Betaproteobacteria bacterium GR16-43]